MDVIIRGAAALFGLLFFNSRREKRGHDNNTKSQAD